MYSPLKTRTNFGVFVNDESNGVSTDYKNAPWMWCEAFPFLVLHERRNTAVMNENFVADCKYDAATWVGAPAIAFHLKANETLIVKPKCTAVQADEVGGIPTIGGSLDNDLASMAELCCRFVYDAFRPNVIFTPGIFLRGDFVV